jgi:hypothetical protein
MFMIIGQNLRYSVRILMKKPGFTSMAALTLALGIGATTAIFSVVYATLFESLPYPKPEQLVIEWRIGVFHNTRSGEGLRSGDVPVIYLPFWQTPWP